MVDGNDELFRFLGVEAAVIERSGRSNAKRKRLLVVFDNAP